MKGPAQAMDTEKIVEGLASKMEEVLDGLQGEVVVAAVAWLASTIALKLADGDEREALEILGAITKAAHTGITTVDHDLH
jgi:hypothetical protein